jgi:hypothetical protein
MPKPEDFWREQKAKPDFQSEKTRAMTYLRYTSREGLPTRRLEA